MVHMSTKSLHNGHRILSPSYPRATLCARQISTEIQISPGDSGGCNSVQTYFYHCKLPLRGGTPRYVWLRTNAITCTLLTGAPHPRRLLGILPPGPPSLRGNHLFRQKPLRARIPPRTRRPVAHSPHRSLRSRSARSVRCLLGGGSIPSTTHPDPRPHRSDSSIREEANAVLTTAAEHVQPSPRSDQAVRLFL